MNNYFQSVESKPHGGASKLLSCKPSRGDRRYLKLTDVIKLLSQSKKAGKPIKSH
jgi:hypothetical protein